MLKIIGEDGKYYILECSVCSKDVELYPEIKQLKRSFRSGKIPCGCSKTPKYSEKQWGILLNRALMVRNDKYSLLNVVGKFNAKCKITLINNDTGNVRNVCLYDFIKLKERDGELDKGFKISSIKRTDYSTILTKVQPIFDKYNKTMICLYYESGWWIAEYICYACSDLSNAGKFRIKVNALEKSGFNCQCHSKSFRRFAEDVLVEVTDSLKGKGVFESFDPEYTTYNNSRVKWACNNGHRNNQMLCNMRRSGYSCPSCTSYGYNPEKSAYFYLVEFLDRGVSYLKYGITNRVRSDMRLKQIFRKTPYEKLVVVYSDGHTILALEKFIKSNFNSGVLDLNITSRFTEVLNIDCKQSLVDLVYKFTTGGI